MQTSDEIIDDLIRREGDKFTDRAADRGGPTKYGITLTTLQAYWPGSPGVEQLQALTEAQARVIYEHRYVNAPQFNLIRDPGLRALVVDTGVQHGQTRAIRMLQMDFALTVDGILGEKSLKTINAAPIAAYCMLLGRRCELYGELIAHDPALTELRSQQWGQRVDDALDKLQALNALGWARRLREFILVAGAVGQ